MVVSNPPFSKRDAIFERLFEILVPQGRMNFHNGEQVKNSPNFQSVYMCNGILDEKIVFANMKKD